MIVGIGIDIVSVERIHTVIDRNGDTFLAKVFGAAEIGYCQTRKDPIPFFAARWAAKEAFYKALPSFLQPMSNWRSIEVTSSGNAAPAVQIVSEELKSGLNAVGNYKIYLSMSHEKLFATAQVVIEVV